MVNKVSETLKSFKAIALRRTGKTICLREVDLLDALATEEMQIFKLEPISQFTS